MPLAQHPAAAVPEGLEWFNTSTPIRLSDLHGRVVLIDFSTFSSIHCQQMQADLRYLEQRFRSDLVVISVHVTRFPGEMRRSHLVKMIGRYRIERPVIHDPELKLSALFGIRRWPTQVLIDHKGWVVGTVSGAGRREQLEQVIRYQVGLCSGRGRLPYDTDCRSAHQTTADILSYPGRLLVAGDRIFIADSGHNRILQITHGGQIRRLYGSDNPGYFDGQGQFAAFSNPQGMALSGDLLYVADTGNHAIRCIDLDTDEVTTVAGNGRGGSRASGAIYRPAELPLNSPADLAFLDGELYIAMTGFHQIWRLSLVADSIRVFAGCGREGLLDGAPDRAEFAQPTALAVLGGDLFCLDATSSALRRINLRTGHVSTLVGSSLYSCGSRDGALQEASFQYPQGLTADSDNGFLWVADTYNNRIRKVAVNTRTVSSMMLDDCLDEPGGLAIDRDTLYIANTNAHQVLRIVPDGGLPETLNVNEGYTSF